MTTKINTKIIDNMATIGNNLLKIIYTSLEEGVFPASWKEKIAKTTRCKEFRPINNLKHQRKSQ